MARLWLRLLIGSLVVECLFGVVARLEELHRLFGGERSFATFTAAAGIGWLAVVVTAALGLSHSVFVARRRLAASEQALASVVRTSRDWLWESDNEMRVTYCSSRVSEQLGYTSQQMLGLDLLTLLPTADQQRARGVLAHAISAKCGWTDMELRWRHADGHLVTLQGSAVPIIDHAGTVVGFRGSRRSVTKAMTAERAVVAAHTRIKQVLQDRSVNIALQPIVDLGTGRLQGAEALARFPDGRGPDIWFAEARETGQCLELDRLAFSAALQRLPTLPPGAYLSVNATPELITDPEWQRLLASGQFPLDRLVVEITEHTEIGHYGDIHIALLPLRERGMRLAIDDAGAGYASFSHVLRLRPDIIKIDRSLITDIGQDVARQSLVAAMTMLAVNLGATLTAEGVETASELNAVKDLGIDNAQGYLLARPSIDPRRWRKWHDRTWQCVSQATHQATPKAVA